MNADQFHADVIALQSNLYHFALMLTSNRDNAHDLVQETTLKALDNKEKFSDGSNLKSWMMTIMRNLFINNCRRQSYAATVVDTTENLYHLNLSQESGLEAPEGSCTTVEITAAIRNLEDDLRQPFSLYLSGYKYEEICTKLSLPMGTVKNRIFMARKVLQRQFSDYR